jgi:hypothetical protein
VQWRRCVISSSLQKMETLIDDAATVIFYSA